MVAMDPRMWTKYYGRIFRESLPDCRVIVDDGVGAVELTTRACRHDVHCSNPLFHGRLGSRGHAPCRRRHFHEELWDTTDVPFVVPALRTPSKHTACFAIPACW